MAETITADMIIHDVVSKYPATVKVFHGHGLPCTACAVGSRESVAGGARTHRFPPEKLDILIKDLNAAKDGQPTSVAPKKAPVGRGIPLQMSAAPADRKIKQVIAIMSGKGGVGKSLVTGLLAVSLRRQGQRVGILDGDMFLLCFGNISSKFNMTRNCVRQVFEVIRTLIEKLFNECVDDLFTQR